MLQKMKKKETEFNILTILQVCRRKPLFSRERIFALLAEIDE